jgi:serralysin
VAHLVGTSGNDTINGTSSNDTIEGAAGSDRLFGGGGHDVLLGGAAADNLFGDDGMDWLEGGTGQDRLTGGAGADAFVFSAPISNANLDFINDYEGIDALLLDAAVFTNIGALGSFVTGDERFVAGAGAREGVEADDRIMYDTTTGRLYYDADGSGAGAAQLFAVLQGAPLLDPRAIAAFNSTATPINGTPGDDSLVGTDASDTINGLGGNDTLDGRGGADTLDGGLGNDTYLITDGDVLSDAGGIDTIVSRTHHTLGSGFENLTLQVNETDDGAFVVNGHGNALDNHIVHEGNATSDLDGGDGNDDITGGTGHDSMFGGAGNDFLVGREGADRLFGNDGNDQLAGSDDMPWVVNEFADTMNGGLGDDTYYVRSESEVLIDAGGIDVVSTTVDWTLGAGFENLWLDGAGLTVHGNELANTFSNGPFWTDDESQAPASTIFAGGGNDTMSANGWLGASTIFHGEDGDDVMHGHSVISATFTGGAGADRFILGGSYDITDFASAEDRIVLDATNMAALGASGQFTAGDARFHAAAGANGGHDADDRVVYNTSTGELFYDADGGGSGDAVLLATLQTGAVLAATDIEVVNGSSSSTITGTEGNDSLTGTPGNDTIDGLGGNDTIDGVGGNDLIIGGAGDDLLFGRDNPHAPEDNQDTLDGGLGDDTYDLRNASGSSDALTLIDAGGHDTVLATGVWTLAAGFEDLTLTGGFSEGGIGTGNDLDNVIRLDGGSFDSFSASGEGGNDTLLGGGGTDVISGGDGDDRIETGDDDTEVDWLTGDAGADSFVFRAQPADNFFADRVTDMASGSDRLVLDGNAFTAIGLSGRFDTGDARFHAAAGGAAHDADDRVIYDTANGDLWYDADGSGAGAAIRFAVLEGAPGLQATDLEVINGAPPGNSDQTLTGTSGSDTLVGGGGNDTLRGLAGADSLVGGASNDWLEGGTGQDRLNGGHGADSFVFNSPVVNANFDFINDFLSGTDKLRLDDAVFATIGGPGAFSAGDERFVAAPGARNGLEADDRLMYDTTSGKLYYDADGSGSGAAAVVAVLQGAPSLTATDIVVI